MDAKQAIELINECKSRTPYQDKYNAVAELIERQERMIEMACEQIAKNGIGCPASMDIIDWPECDAECEIGKNEADCWKKYLEQEA